MRKIWGLAVLSAIHSTAFANTNIVAAQCKDYMQPENWKPLASLPKHAIDIVADDLELQGTDSAEFSGNVVINTETMSLEARRALIDKKEGLLMNKTINNSFVGILKGLRSENIRGISSL